MNHHASHEFDLRFVEELPPGLRARQRGVAMLLVLVMVAMAAILGMSFLSAQTTTMGITRNLEDQAIARQIAESGMLIVRQRILADEGWRTGRAQGAWVTNQALGPGTFTIEIIDEDGDPADDPADAFTLVVTGRYGQVTHVVRSHVQPFVNQGDAGLDLSYFVSSKSLDELDDIDWDAAPTRTEVAAQVNRPQEGSGVAAYEGGPTRYFGMLFKGEIEIPASGLWTFYTESDDGSALYIDGSRVVNNDKNHAWQSRGGTVSLDAGRHGFEVRFYENDIDQGIIAYWQGPGVSKEIIPADVFFRSSGEGSGSQDDAGKTDDEKAVAVATDTAVTMWGQSVIDSYVSKKGPYSDSNSAGKARVSTNSILPLSVQMGDQAKVKGKVLVKPLLPVLPVVTWGSSSITDGVGWLHNPYYIRKISMPSNPPSSSGKLECWSSDTLTINQDKRYSKIAFGNNARIVIDGDVTIWCTGSFEAHGNAQLVINPGSSLKLYVGGEFNSSGNAILHGDSASPGALEVLMATKNILELYGDAMQLSGNVSMSAYIHNPNGPLRMYGNSVIHGRYYGQSLTMSGSPSFHVDTPPVGKDAEEEVAGQTTYVFAWDEGL